MSFKTLVLPPTTVNPISTRPLFNVASFNANSKASLSIATIFFASHAVWAADSSVNSTSTNTTFNQNDFGLTIIDNVGGGVNQHDFKRNTHKQPFLVAVNAAALGPVLQKPNHGSKNVDIGLETTDCIGEQLRDGVGDAQAVN